jgi:hypothetical protein
MAHLTMNRLPPLTTIHEFETLERPEAGRNQAIWLDF